MHNAVNDLDVVFKALADPFRRRLLMLLSDSQYFCQSSGRTVHGICVRDLSRHLDAPQSTVSRHLAILSGSGLVSHDRDRTWHYYSVNPARLTETVDWLNRLMTADANQTPTRGAALGSPSP
ncbi:MAG: metalloregulator ArsR/SmtB family transcription factor [Thermaerobacter sp.]|nr:metalloregulator ArsR/SmtB family transcription factor [Thermaerobacter sp.]